METIRYGFLGVWDVNPWIAFPVVAGMCIASSAPSRIFSIDPGDVTSFDLGAEAAAP